MDMPISVFSHNFVSAGFAIYGSANGEALRKFAKPEAFEEMMKDDGARGLIVYDDPRTLIAACIAEDIDVVAALEDWEKDARRYIQFIRRYRRRLLVVERSAETRDRIQRAVRAFFSFDAVLPHLQPPQTVENPLTKILSTYIAMQNCAVKRQLTELQASSAVSAADFPPSSEQPDAIIRSLKDVRRLAEEKDLLLRQITQLQSNLREVSTRSFNEMTKKLERAEGEIKVLGAQVAQIRNSTSWRITAPLRAFARLVGRG